MPCIPPSPCLHQPGKQLAVSCAGINAPRMCLLWYLLHHGILKWLNANQDNICHFELFIPSDNERVQSLARSSVDRSNQHTTCS